MEEIEEPLEYLSRAKIQREMMQNFERLIKKSTPTSNVRWWWDHSVNWVKVQSVVNANTTKAGSTSSGRQCIFMGIHPDKYSCFDLIEGTTK